MSNYSETEVKLVALVVEGLRAEVERLRAEVERLREEAIRREQERAVEVDSAHGAGVCQGFATGESERRDLKDKLDHARAIRDKAERERDAARAEVERLRVALHKPPASAPWHRTATRNCRRRRALPQSPGRCSSCLARTALSPRPDPKEDGR